MKSETLLYCISYVIVHHKKDYKKERQYSGQCISCGGKRIFIGVSLKTCIRLFILLQWCCYSFGHIVMIINYSRSALLHDCLKVYRSQHSMILKHIQKMNVRPILLCSFYFYTPAPVLIRNVSIFVGNISTPHGITTYRIPI